MVSEVVRVYGVSARMLRFYEAKGLIASVRREDYEYRMYSMDVIDCPRMVIILRRLRVSLKDIAVLLGDTDANEKSKVIGRNIANSFALC